MLTFDTDGSGEIYSLNKMTGEVNCFASCGPQNRDATEDEKAHAEFIVKALNAHDALLDALKDMMATYNEAHPVWVKAAAALAKAEGK